MDYYKLKVLNNKKKIIIVLVSLVMIVIACYYYFIYKKENNSDSISLNTIEINNDENEVSNYDIYVDIKGFVNKPGVYSFHLLDNARINDLINKAGGLMKEADTSTINLSKKLEDEMTVIIYSKNEIKDFLKTQNELKQKLEICENKLKNNACIKIEGSKTNDTKININEANLNELLTLSGIGEVKAKAIIEYREKTKFKSIEEIKNVEGIGENLFISIKENITV